MSSQQVFCRKSAKSDKKLKAEPRSWYNQFFYLLEIPGDTLYRDSIKTKLMKYEEGRGHKFHFHATSRFSAQISKRLAGIVSQSFNSIYIFFSGRTSLWQISRQPFFVSADAILNVFSIWQCRSSRLYEDDHSETPSSFVINELVTRPPRIKLIEKWPQAGLSSRTAIYRVPTLFCVCPLRDAFLENFESPLFARAAVYRAVYKVLDCMRWKC